MKNTATKQFVLGILVFAALAGLQVVLADGQGSPSPYHIPVDTGLNLDTSLVLGASMYGVGMALTSGARAIQAKLQGTLVN